VRASILVATSGVLWAATAQAAPADTVAFQGRLLNATGEAVSGEFTVTASIYPSAGAEVASWSETHPSQAVEGGTVHLQLGSVTPLPLDLFADGPRYVEVTTSNATTGRMPINAVPMAHTGLGLAALGSEPVACTAAAIGRLYFDTSLAVVRVCDGDAWFSMVRALPGTDSGVPAQSCLDVLDADPTAVSGPYWIDVNGVATQLYCDMTPGNAGWMLVGQVQGRHNMYDAWLRSDTRPENLLTPSIEPSTWSSIDAIDLAVNHASEVRLSTGNVARFARWPLPSGRDTATLWNHSVGQAAIEAAPTPTLTVTGHNGSGTCYTNRYGIMPNNAHGGSYPYAGYNGLGNTGPGDWCMAVGVQIGGTVHGFTQNGNGYDGPSSNTDLPNGSINNTPEVSVWLR